MTRDKPDMDRLPGSPAWAWLSVFVVLCLGVLILVASIMFFYLTGDRYAQRMTLHWPGTSLAPSVGEPEYRDNGLVIGPLRPRQRFTVELSHEGISAEHFATLRLHMEAGSGRVRYELVWSDPDQPGRVLGAHLPPVAPGEQVIDLTARAGWRGDIHRLFLVAEGPIEDPVTLHQVSLLPAQPSMATLLRQVWRQWTAVEGWRGHSINFIAGGVRTPLVSPVLAAALWITLSVLLYTLWMLIRGCRPGLVPLTMIVLVGWVALDLRWQVDLMQQVQATANRYTGKEYSEKRLAGEDRDLHRFAEEIKARLPEADSGRVFLIVPEILEGAKYLRARMHYLLRSYNVGSSWTEPPSEELVRPDDHLLILRPHAGVEFDPDSGRLAWGDNRTLRVDRLMAHPTGELYRVRAQTETSAPGIAPSTDK